MKMIRNLLSPHPSFMSCGLALRQAQGKLWAAFVRPLRGSNEHPYGGNRFIHSWARRKTKGVRHGLRHYLDGRTVVKRLGVLSGEGDDGLVFEAGGNLNPGEIL